MHCHADRAKAAFYKLMMHDNKLRADCFRHLIEEQCGNWEKKKKVNRVLRTGTVLNNVIPYHSLFSFLLFIFYSSALLCEIVGCRQKGVTYANSEHERQWCNGTVH